MDVRLKNADEDWKRAFGGGGGARGRPFVASFDGITTVVIFLFVCLKLTFCQWYTYQRVAVTMPIPVILVED